MIYHIVFGFVKLLSLLPLRILYVFSDLLYPVIYYFIGYRKQVVRENMICSFPDKSEKERTETEKKFYRHFCDLIVESVKFAGISQDEINRRITYHNYESALKHFDEGRSILLYASHYANWEWNASFILHLPKDKPVYPIYKKQTSEVSDRIIYKIRNRFGTEPIEMKNLLRTMVSMRKNGQLGMFGLISDQSPSRGSMHYYTQFLHQRTAVITGTEQLARKFDYPVYYTRMKKIKRGYYTSELVPVSLHPNETPEYEISEKYMRLLEEDILRDPSLWLWTHKRWKYTRKRKN